MLHIDFFCFIHALSLVNSYSNSESAESNRIEVAPFYDTIIYSDVADILNDFENNRVSPFDIFTDSESQSDENVENLLTEYHHYLEKAHKQRQNAVDKPKPKNKVPLLRHDKYSRIKPGGEYKHNEFYYKDFYNPDFKLPHTIFNNPLDAFISDNSKGKYINKLEITPSTSNGIPADPLEKIFLNNKKIMDLPEIVPPPGTCKQCLIHIEPISQNQQNEIRLLDDQKQSGLQHLKYYNAMGTEKQNINNNVNDLPENSLNIHIKIDLQLPKFQDNISKYETYGGTLAPKDILSKELATSIKLPFTYFNFPLPMDYFGNKKHHKHSTEDTAPAHKMQIHKKKKSRTNNNSKKHRKKIITFHNIKVAHQPMYPIRFIDNYTNIFENNNSSNMTTGSSTIQPTTILLHDISAGTNNAIGMVNDTQTEANLMVNISNNTTDTQREDRPKIENSIEVDFTKIFSNASTMPPIIREKRDIINLNKGSVTPSDEKAPKEIINLNKGNVTPSDEKAPKDIINLNKGSVTPSDEKASKDIITSNSSKENNIDKKLDKNLLADAELLYWPNISENKIDVVNKKNITTIILENEYKKAKLNMSKDSIRKNHTKALEQAIFGDVNWDDIDTVAPALMSFVGKYVHGVLTFCSEYVCHSMNCAEKVCLHRICQPGDRLNNKGHCIGSNTDSVASMESIMDLPSNITLEIVDMLERNMLGKIFGKATFCIGTKCVTLTAIKKIFTKTRCTIKELNKTGHCSMLKH